MRIFQSRAHLAIFLATFTGLTVLFLFVSGDWLRRAFVIPVLYFFWLVSKIANSIDQQILWIGLFLLTAFGLSQVYLYSKRRSMPVPDENDLRSSHGRVKYWLIYVNLMLKGVYYRSYYSEELKRLILSVLAIRERLLPIEIEQRIMDGDLVVPPQVKAFFVSPKIYSAATIPELAVHKLNVLIHPEMKENRPEKLEDLQAVIAFLEEQLERK